MNRTLLPSTCSPPGRDQRGVAMLFALMVLGSLGILTMFLVASGAVNRRMGSDDVTKLKALRYAEAGVFEAMARIQRGEGPDIDDLGAPRQVVQVLNASAVSAAGAGHDASSPPGSRTATGCPTPRRPRASARSRSSSRPIPRAR